MFRIPNMTDWCPQNLMSISLLAAYYNQLPFEQAILNNWELPNAIYLDVLDVDGTIRTGANFGLLSDSMLIIRHHDLRYSRTRTARSRRCEIRIRCNCFTRQLENWCVFFSLHVESHFPGCSKLDSPLCTSLAREFGAERAKYPMRRWNDVAHGRLVDWNPS